MPQSFVPKEKQGIRLQSYFQFVNYIIFYSADYKLKNLRTL